MFRIPLTHFIAEVRRRLDPAEMMFCAARRYTQFHFRLQRYKIILKYARG